MTRENLTDSSWRMFFQKEKSWQRTNKVVHTAGDPVKQAAQRQFLTSKHVAGDKQEIMDCAALIFMNWGLLCWVQVKHFIFTKAAAITPTYQSLPVHMTWRYTGYKELYFDDSPVGFTYHHKIRYKTAENMQNTYLTKPRSENLLKKRAPEEGYIEVTLDVQLK